MVSAPTGVLTHCPYCGQQIGSELLEHINDVEERRLKDERIRLEEEFGHTLSEQVRAKTADLEAKTKAAREQAEKLQDDLESRVSEEVQTKTAELEGAVNAARREAEKLQQDLEARVINQVQAKTAELEAQAAAARAQAEKLQEDLEAKVNEAVRIKTEQLEVERLHAEESVERLKRELNADHGLQLEAEKKAIEAEFRGAILEKDKKLELFTKKVDELQKQAEGKTAWELGMQQDELVELLRSEFPRDRVGRIEGRSGADVIHDVQQNGESCGKIIYESKNAQTWANDWVAKLHRDKTDSGATVAVLVSVAFPAKQRDFCMVDGIPVVHPRLLASLVHVLRQSLIDLEIQALGFHERGSKLENLAIYMGSPDFRNKMANILRAAEKLEALQAKEKKALDGIWKDQLIQFRVIRTGTNDVDAEVRAIMTGSGAAA